MGFEDGCKFDWESNLRDERRDMCGRFDCQLFVGTPMALVRAGLKIGTRNSSVRQTLQYFLNIPFAEDIPTIRMPKVSQLMKEKEQP